MRRFIPFNWDDIPLSKSSVLGYKQCPYRFYQQYVKQVPFEKTPALARGIDFHKRVHRLYDYLDKDLVESGEANIQQMMEDLLPDDPLFKKFAILEAERYEELKKVGRCDLFFPLHRELYLKNMDLMFSGTVDRVDKLPDGTYVVLDYKTGKFRKYNMSSYRFELLGYKMLVDSNKLLDKPITRGCIMFPEIPLFKWFDFRVSLPKTWFKTLNTTRERIRNRMFQKNITILCDWCSYAKDCLLEELKEVKK